MKILSEKFLIANTLFIVSIYAILSTISLFIPFSIIAISKGVFLDDFYIPFVFTTCILFLAIINILAIFISLLKNKNVLIENRYKNKALFIIVACSLLLIFANFFSPISENLLFYKFAVVLVIGNILNVWVLNFAMRILCKENGDTCRIANKAHFAFKSILYFASVANLVTVLSFFMFFANKS